MKSPLDWPALAPSRGSLFGIPDALGYNPVQLPRYWRYIRSTNELSVFYNASVLNVPSPEDVRVLGLRYLVVPTGIEPPVGGRVVEEADGYSLWELDDAQPLSTVTSMVEFVDDLASAMDEVTTSGFDPAEEAVIEPSTDVFTCVGDCPPTAPAVTTAISGSELVIQVPESEGGILTIRNAYEAGWQRGGGRSSRDHDPGGRVPPGCRPPPGSARGRPHLSRRRGDARTGARCRHLARPPLGADRRARVRTAEARG